MSMWRPTTRAWWRRFRSSRPNRRPSVVPAEAGGQSVCGPRGQPACESFVPGLDVENEPVAQETQDVFTFARRGDLELRAERVEFGQQVVVLAPVRGQRRIPRVFHDPLFGLEMFGRGLAQCG